MKVLVIQLARFGDIYQTWPVLRALAREGHEVHVLVKSRFASALDGLDCIAKAHKLDTRAVLSPIVFARENSLALTLSAADEVCERLSDERFDRLINLSFSPLSSWLTFELECRALGKAANTPIVSGYTRHSDGFLAIPDDSSAYFYAQVGSRVSTSVDRSPNRIHVTQLMASVAGVDLIESDWSSVASGRSTDGATESSAAIPADLLGRLLEAPYVAVHIGASEETKTLDVDGWAEIIKSVVRRYRIRVVLLGSADERTKAEDIVKKVVDEGSDSQIPAKRLLSLVGETTLPQAFTVLGKAELLIAGDSALVHIASLVGCAVLNLSSRSVSHWETGPLSKGSRVILYGGASPSKELVTGEIGSMLGVSEISGSNARADRIVEGPLALPMSQRFEGREDFLWGIVAAIYMGADFPAAPDDRFVEAVQQWIEIAEIESVQLRSLKSKSGDANQSSAILDRIDQVVHLLVDAEERLAPIERWWKTEKIRWGPQPVEGLIEKSLNLNEQLQTVLQQWQRDEGLIDRHQLEF